MERGNKMTSWPMRITILPIMLRKTRMPYKKYCVKRFIIRLGQWEQGDTIIILKGKGLLKKEKLCTSGQVEVSD